MGQKFQYKTVFIWGWSSSTTKKLDELGNQGWELVSVNWVWFYFKRPLN